MECKDFIEKLKEESDILERIDDFEAVRDRLSIRLMNPETQSERLSALASIPFLDLRITFTIILMEDEKYRGMIRVSRELADAWGVSDELILQSAIENDRRKGHFHMESMADTLRAFSPEGFDILEQIEKVENNSKEKMYTIMENSSHNGSAALLMNDLLGTFAAELDCDMLILPSSVNELICIKDCSDADYDWLRSIVREVNHSAVPYEDILSYNVYRYSRRDNCVSVVA